MAEPAKTPTTLAAAPPSGEKPAEKKAPRAPGPARTAEGAIAGVRTTEEAAEHAKVTALADADEGGIWPPPWHVAAPATPHGGPASAEDAKRAQARQDLAPDVPRSRVVMDVRVRGVVERDKVAALQAAVEHLKTAVRETGLECRADVVALPV
jgi:hypothetical protein